MKCIGVFHARQKRTFAGLRSWHARLLQLRTCVAFSPLLLLLVVPFPTVASSDLFSFTASEGNFHFWLQMVGSEDPGIVQVSSSDFKGFMPYKDYHVTFDRKSKTAFARPLRPSLEGLPWFEMTVSGETGTLVYNGRRIKGEARWEIP